MGREECIYVCHGCRAELHEIERFATIDAQGLHMKKIRLLLLEDNRLLRDGITAMLKEQPDMKIVASSGDTDTLLRIKKLNPYVVLLDLGLRSHNSLRVVELVRREAPEAKIIVMDLVPVQAELVEFVQAGVSGFILKDATLDDFLKTIRSVAEGEKVLPPLMTESLFTQIVEYAARKGSGNLFKSVRMTKRERQIVDLIAEGLSNKEIARKLDIAIDTVKSHVHNILEKMALHTRLEIASFAHRGHH
jgi:DNA-binding NarL/FixJ family response regulator